MPLTPSTDSESDSGTYTGDGVTTGRTIETDGDPVFVYIKQGGTARAYELTADAEGMMVQGGALANDITDTTSVYLTGGGFVVGDGTDDGNVDLETYHYVAVLE